MYVKQGAIEMKGSKEVRGLWRLGLKLSGSPPGNQCEPILTLLIVTI